MLDTLILYMLLTCVGVFILAMFYKQVFNKVSFITSNKSPAKRELGELQRGFFFWGSGSWRSSLKCSWGSGSWGSGSWGSGSWGSGSWRSSLKCFLFIGLIKY